MEGENRFLMKKVIISGATSMIGLALIRKCIKEDVEVLALVNRESKRKDRLPLDEKIKVVECDLAQMEKDISEQKISKDYDVFYHLAWAGTSHLGRQDVRIHLQNVSYTIDAVEIASKLGCYKFIGAGSQAEYGKKNVALSGDTETNPEVPYGIAKLCAGQMSKVRCDQLNMQHVWTRILSAYGPFDNENTVIPLLIKALLRKEHFKTTEGKQIWELIYVDDVADALFLIGKSGVSGKIYPIGTGDARPLKDLLEIVKNQIDPNVKLGYGEIKYGKNQVMHLEADISELTKDTGFLPQVSFEKGIKRTIDYYRSKEENINIM